ncbi:MAG: hypothetical protein ACJ8HI_05490 [Massilia sp.]
MNSKYFLFALLVTAATTGTSWVKLISSATASGGSSWSSHGGGGHK